MISIGSQDSQFATCMVFLELKHRHHLQHYTGRQHIWDLGKIRGWQNFSTLAIDQKSVKIRKDFLFFFSFFFEPVYGSHMFFSFVADLRFHHAQAIIRRLCQLRTSLSSLSLSEVSEIETKLRTKEKTNKQRVLKKFRSFKHLSYRKQVLRFFFNWNCKQIWGILPVLGRYTAPRGYLAPQAAQARWKESIVDFLKRSSWPISFCFC